LLSILVQESQSINTPNNPKNKIVKNIKLLQHFDNKQRSLTQRQIHEIIENSKQSTTFIYVNLNINLTGATQNCPVDRAKVICSRGIAFPCGPANRDYTHMKVKNHQLLSEWDELGSLQISAFD
jgi:hypothetical protein